MLKNVIDKAKRLQGEAEADLHIRVATLERRISELQQVVHELLVHKQEPIKAPTSAAPPAVSTPPRPSLGISQAVVRHAGGLPQQPAPQSAPTPAPEPGLGATTTSADDAAPPATNPPEVTQDAAREPEPGIEPVPPSAATPAPEPVHGSESADAKADGKTLVIDQDECISCGTCVENADSVFVLPDDGCAVPVAQEGPMDLIQDAIDACPVTCIHWSHKPEQFTQLNDADGQPIN